VSTVRGTIGHADMQESNSTMTSDFEALLFDFSLPNPRFTYKHLPINRKAAILPSLFKIFFYKNKPKPHKSPLGAQSQ
jgi:hypothetical protein